MSRFSAPSDRDYQDEPWDRPEPCATRGCDNHCDIPATSAFCYECRCRDLIARAVENDRHRAEAAVEAARRGHKAGAA